MKRTDPALLPAQVANTILGGGFSSLLIEELRVKRSLTYSASSGFVAAAHRRRLPRRDLHQEPDHARDPRSWRSTSRGASARARSIRSSSSRRRRTWSGSFPLRVETPDALATRLAEIEFHGLPIDDLATYRSRVAAVTAADAERAAREWMPTPADVSIVVIGKAAEVRAPLEQRFGPVTVVQPEACENPATLVAGPGKN